MKKTPFFARRVRGFGNVAVVILVIIFFLVPFAFRGARMAITNIRNEVTDWLPSDFPETKELDWFRDHFLNERFVLATWPGCNEDDPAFRLFVEKVRAEVLSPDESTELDNDGSEKTTLTAAEIEKRKEQLAVHKLGDQLGLSHPGDSLDDPTDDDYHFNWGGREERWLRGDDGQWYFITPDEKLYRWDGQNNIIGFVTRKFHKLVTGSNSANGTLVREFQVASQPDAPNEYYEDPRKLFARFFNSVTTGPEVLEQMIGEGGSLTRGSDELATDKARKLAFERLQGILFGPHPPKGFEWTFRTFEKVLPEYKKAELLKKNSSWEHWEKSFEEFVSAVVVDHFDGDREALADAPREKQAEHWDALFEHMGVTPVKPQTCIVVTLSEPGHRDMARVIGRRILGKPYGRLLYLAFNECGIDEDDIRMGGPSVDNVAIDQEASVTLLNLLFWSAAVGMGLSFACFRSVRVTFMVFFVGGTAAATSLGIVWWTGGAPDAILMSMPSLVYVLGLSGAVHIINYYRDAVQENGVEGAPETAIRHGWFPCTLAAFTTALGLLSLCVSNLTPIKKFGFYAALGVMATVILLFTFLPSALQVWAPNDQRRKSERNNAGPQLSQWIAAFWSRIGGWVVERHKLVTAGCVVVLIVFGLGLPYIDPSVQLLKLFHKKATIIRDYRWLETHLGKLVPMELVVRVARRAQQPTLDQLNADTGGKLAPNSLQYSLLERAEMAERIQSVVEETFGENGQDIVGRGMSVATFLPPLPSPKGGTILNERATFASMIEDSRDELIETDFLRIDKDEKDRSELWRVSLRLGALNDVDYGAFVGDLKLAVEPVMSAYRYRNQILRRLEERGGSNSIRQARVLVLGGPVAADETPSKSTDRSTTRSLQSINQTAIFASTLQDLLLNRGFRSPSQNNQKPKQEIQWHLPESQPLREHFKSDELWAKFLSGFDCVVVARDHADYDLDLIQQHSNNLIDARDHQFDPATSLTAADRKIQGDEDTTVTVVYTGIVPIVYKAQRTLLRSLVDSIGLAFVMIALVMMLLLRDWRRRPDLAEFAKGIRHRRFESIKNSNLINVSGGLTSMLPNVFPVVVIFGAMGYFGVQVDIGTMMTASVAMGVAVDDTIHFLNWFRHGLRIGLDRKQAIALAYDRCATAMTQTTLIGGFGLAVFAFSTFTPTQQFGIMMMVLLQAALVGDLIFLPALLAGPLGRYFEVAPDSTTDSKGEPTKTTMETSLARAETPHSGSASQTSTTASIVRRDDRHDRLR